MKSYDVVLEKINMEDAVIHLLPKQTGSFLCTHGSFLCIQRFFLCTHGSFVHMDPFFVHMDPFFVHTDSFFVHTDPLYTQILSLYTHILSLYTWILSLYTRILCIDTLICCQQGTRLKLCCILQVCTFPSFLQNIVENAFKQNRRTQLVGALTFACLLFYLEYTLLKLYYRHARIPCIGFCLVVDFQLLTFKRDPNPNIAFIMNLPVARRSDDIWW